MQQTRILVGVDVSKETLDYTWIPGGSHKQVSNTATGINKLIDSIAILTPEMVVVEATGGYQTPLVTALHKRSVPVKVVNPRQVRDFAKSLNRLGKTDKLDALTLAEFGLSRTLEPDIPKTQYQIVLSSVLQLREQINAMLIAEHNYLEHAHERHIERIKDHISFLKKNYSP